jgi:hypothetical protein
VSYLSLPKIKSVRIDGAALQARASLGCARDKEVFNFVSSRWPKILEKKKPSREATDR